MTVRRLDDNGDIITRGQQFIGGRGEVVQTIKTRLALFYGEYFRNIKDGTPWYEQILGKFANLDTAEAALRARIARTPKVVRLLDFNTDFDIDTRKYTVSTNVLTEYGLIEVSYNG